MTRILSSRILTALPIIILFIAGCIHVKNHFIDYPVYELAAQKIIQGKAADIYDVTRQTPGGFYYSFFFAVCFIPFTLLGTHFGKILFFLIFFGCYLKILDFSIKSALGEKARVDYQNYRAVGALTVLLTAYSANDAFMDANIGIILLTLCLLSYELRIRRPWVAGILLGIAIVFKIYPVAVLGYFVWERRIKVCVSALITIGLLYFALPLIFYGTAEGVQLILNHWQVVEHFGQHWSFDSPKFQNWPSTFTRFAGHFKINKQIAFRTSVVLIVVATIGFYLKSFFIAVKSEIFCLRMFSLCLALIPIAVPVSWYNMGLFYAPVIAFHASRTEKKSSLVALTLFILFYCLSAPDLVGIDFNHALENAGVPFFGAAALVGIYFATTGSTEVNTRST
jgi:hypothetical protein